MNLLGSGSPDTGLFQYVPITTLIFNSDSMTGFFRQDPVGFAPQYLPASTIISDGSPLSGYFRHSPVPQTLTAGSTLYASGSVVPQSVAVPEPGSLALLIGMGVAGSVFFCRRLRVERRAAGDGR